MLNFYKIGVQGLILIIATARVMFSRRWNIAELGERNKFLEESVQGGKVAKQPCYAGTRTLASSVFSISSCGFDHSEEVCVWGVAAALVACREDEPAAFGGIVNRFFARGDYVIW